MVAKCWCAMVPKVNALHHAINRRLFLSTIKNNSSLLLDTWI